MDNSRPTRIVTFIKRRSDITEQQFYDHWGNIHASLIVPWALKHNFEYTQIHTPKHMRNQFKATVPAPFDEVLDYDGAAEWNIPSLEKLIEAFGDPYYRDVIEPDEHNFLHKSSKEAISTTAHGIWKPIVLEGKALVNAKEEMLQYQKIENRELDKE
ncbi:MAG: hypothetical protein M1834_004475 [Cirrosporium novae-zelandiae]|nr:MAG: hypothetical protein M1834_004475 [Cirrosporium novae-zelandiae]